MSSKKPNALINETSPYLLQHAYNPVNWVAWNEHILQQAQSENKIVLLSIGYSSCHWCHVMEHECFEDEATAEIMNKYFICVKIDREERPDIDAIYMQAVQLMNNQGGWPLNCFILPNGKPFYGGTYFPKERWQQILHSINDTYTKDPNRIIEFADRLTKGIQQSDWIADSSKTELSNETITEGINKWKPILDYKEGGQNRAPKFPLPTNYSFLLEYAHKLKDEELNKQVLLTLDKMGGGGIYDCIGGGFSRYSVDEYWKVPHFEKMLYDNAQLISLYSKAFYYTQNNFYKSIVEESVSFVMAELCNKELFFSALDADSEGVEGKYYVWTEKEFEAICKEDSTWAKEYFGINADGYWEHNNYICVRKKDISTLAKEFKLKTEILETKISALKGKLLTHRNQRIKPGLDDKCLCSWNAMMIKALCDAALFLNDNSYLKTAESKMELLLKIHSTNSGGLYRTSKEGKASINAFLDDYSFTIEALLALYYSTGNSNYISKAVSLLDHVIENFYNPENGMFFYTQKDETGLIHRMQEVNDNVIPASNSSMADCLWQIGLLESNSSKIFMCRKILSNVKDKYSGYPPAYSNYMRIALLLNKGVYVLKCSGNISPRDKEVMAEFEKKGVLINYESKEGPVSFELCTENSCLLKSLDIESVWNSLNRSL